MSNTFKVGDKVTVKASAMGTGTAADCTLGKAYVVTHVGLDSTKEFAKTHDLPLELVLSCEYGDSEDNVSFTDDVGDFVIFLYEEVELAQ